MARGSDLRELSVGEVARRAGVAVSALHYYEAEGLIVSRRTRAGHRRYGRDVLRRIAVIRVAQSAGLSLREISGALARLPAHRTPTVQDWTTLSSEWHAMLSARIAALERLRDDLGACVGCGCLSLTDCPLRNAGDRLAEEGPGPRLMPDPGSRPPARPGAGGRPR